MVGGDGGVMKVGGAGGAACTCTYTGCMQEFIVNIINITTIVFTSMQ